MIPYNLDATIYLPVAIAIVMLAYWRIRADDRWFAPDATFWFPIRRLLFPIFDLILSRLPIPAKTRISEDEHVATLYDLSLEEAHQDLSEAGYEPQPLASIGHDWKSRPERSSWARYYGTPIFGIEGSPDWLRRYQVHARPFADDDRGPVTLTAHSEYNPWHPVYALPHALGIGLDTDVGVGMLADDLGIEAVPAPGH